jgi:hypothetical protein
VSLLYDRRAVVTVVPRQAGEEIRIEGLRIAFDVAKTISADSNKATLDIYNLAQATRDRLHARGDVIRLEAGYAAVSELLYEGEITKASSGRSGADFSTTIECGDGDATFSTQSVEQFFEAGTRVRDVIKLVAGSFTKATPDRETETVKFGPKAKKPKKKTEELPPRIRFRDIEADLSALDTDLAEAQISLVLRRAMTVAGNAAEVMDKLARMWRFDWSVQDGVFQLTSFGRALVGESVLISPETGLIGVPLKTEHGVSFSALLIPQLRPGVEVRVESETVEGSFRAETVRFLGDTHGDSWTAEVEARSLAEL